MVSVIIPSYNRKNLTHRAVRSVLAQTFADLEVVVVDDGSRDEEVFLCHAVEDRRVRVVRHETNKGVPAARNTGIQAARGGDFGIPRFGRLLVPEQAGEPDGAPRAGAGSGQRPDLLFLLLRTERQMDTGTARFSPERRGLERVTFSSGRETSMSATGWGTALCSRSFSRRRNCGGTRIGTCC